MNKGCDTVKSGSWRLSFGVLAACMFLLVVYWLTYAYAHDWNQRYLRGEDKLVEWITAISFLAAAFVMGRLAALNGRWVRTYFAGMALFFFVCAGEEMSWGQRLIGFETPAGIREVNEQDEFNLHNMDFEHLHPKDIVSAIIKGFGIVLPLVAWNRWPTVIPALYALPVFLFGELLSPVRRMLHPVLLARFGDVVALEAKLDTAEFTEMMWGVSVLVASLTILAATRAAAASSKPPPP